MKVNITSLTIIISMLWALSFTVIASDLETAQSLESVENTQKAITLDVFKTPTCGCCQKWVDHIEQAGFSSNVHNLNNLDKLKRDKGINSKHQSCPTAISAEGYVFEGHTPATIIKQFLANPPKDSIGLAVPGMPMGSPGMEMGSRRQNYDVLLLKSDGSSMVYQKVINES